VSDEKSPGSRLAKSEKTPFKLIIQGFFLVNKTDICNSYINSLFLIIDDDLDIKREALSASLLQ